VDHINRDSLDNRRENLRSASHSQNLINCRKRQSKSGLRGVYPHKLGWQARAAENGKWKALGTFRNAEDAARARDAYVLKTHGEFAILNFPVTDTNSD
jgi:hypothetical protein